MQTALLTTLHDVSCSKLLCRYLHYCPLLQSITKQPPSCGRQLFKVMCVASGWTP